MYEDEITQYIQHVLQRDPNPGEVEAWQAIIDSGQSLEDVRDLIIDSAEAVNNVYPVILAYQAIYGRVPDAGGLDYWTGRYEAMLGLDNPNTPEIENNPSLDDPETTTVNEALVSLLHAFVDTEQPEFAARYGIDPSGDQFVAAAYTNVLNRAPDQAGLNYWQGRYEQIHQQLEAQAAADAAAGETPMTPEQIDIETRAQILEQFVSSAEYENNTADLVDQFLANAADEVTGAYSGSLWDLQDETGGNVGDTFTLTTDLGEQAIGTENNDTINAIVGGADATLNNFDHVDGAGGTDTMNIIVGGPVPLPVIPSSASIEGVEIFNIDQTSGVLVPDLALGALNAAQFGPDATQIWQENNAQNIANLSDGQTAGFRDVTVGSAVQYQDDVAAADVALDSVTSGSSVNILGNGLTSATVSGTVDAAAPGVPGTLVVSVGSVAGFPAFSDTDVDTHITTLNLNLDSDVNLFVGGADGVMLETVDASGSTGGITNNVAFGANDFIALNSIIGGSGDDSQTIDMAGFQAAAVSIDGGAGNDMLTILADGAISTTAVAVTATGGAGNDTTDVNGLANILTASTNGITAGLLTLADFNADDDVLDLSDVGAQDQLTNTELADIAAATSLFDAVSAAAAVTDAGVYSVFDYGGNMYAFIDNDVGSDFTAGDGLIQVTGLSVEDLDATNFVA